MTIEQLKQLIHKKEYLTCLKEIGDSKDPKIRLLAVLCYVYLENYDKALDEIENNQTLLEKGALYDTIKIHFELLLTKKLFDEAKIALKHYESLPYESQKVEELMRDIKKDIDDLEHPKASETITIDKVCEELENGTNYSIHPRILFSLGDFNVNKYADSLKKYLLRKDANPNLRTYGLIALKDQNYSKKVSFLTNDEKLIDVIPSELPAPFLSDDYVKITELIVKICARDTSLIDISNHLFNCYILDTYPMDIYLENENVLAEAIVQIGKSYLSIKQNAVSQEVNDLADKIKGIIEKTPVLKA